MKELDVGEIPVVVGDADPRAARLAWRLLLEPGDECVGRVLRPLHRGGDIGLVGHLAGERGQYCALLFHPARPMEPEVARIAGEVLARLFQQRRDRPQQGGEVGGLLAGKREAIPPEFDRPVRLVALARRLIALLVEHGEIESGTPRPWAQDAMIEIEAIHLRAHDLEIDLPRHGPALDVERCQPALPAGQRAVLRGHRGSGVVGDAVDDLGTLERAPLSEESDQVIVAGARGEDGGDEHRHVHAVAMVASHSPRR